MGSRQFLCWSLDEGGHVFGKIVLTDVSPSAAAAQYAREHDRLVATNRVHEVIVAGVRYGIRRSHDHNGIEYIVCPVELEEPALTL